MQDDTGLKRVLTIPSIYILFQNFIARRSGTWKWMMENFWKLKGGEKVIDAGCGPGDLLNYLPSDIDYYGFDLSEDYIRAAHDKFGERGTFIVGTARDFLDNPDKRFNNADLIICNGLLHHLDDNEVIELLELSKRIMIPTGRLVCYEATFLAYQTRLSKWILSKDRGGNIRQEQEWKELVGRVFDSFSTHVLTGLIRIPYVHIIIECRKEA